MTLRPSILTLMIVSAGVSAVANAVGAAAPEEKTRLGSAIEQDIAARDRNAAQRARALELREQAARAIEARLGARSPAAAAVPEAGAAPIDPIAERYAELARIYQAMKPKAAALVFEQLAMDVQVEVAGRMRERSTAAIMASMTPRGAATLTMALARKGSAIVR